MRLNNPIEKYPQNQARLIRFGHIILRPKHSFSNRWLIRPVSRLINKISPLRI